MHTLLRHNLQLLTQHSVRGSKLSLTYVKCVLMAEVTQVQTLQEGNHMTVAFIELHGYTQTGKA